MKKFALVLLVALCGTVPAFAQQRSHPADAEKLLAAFQHPSETAKPWIFWYWMEDAVTPEGITADLEAMRKDGIGGAYLMTIDGAATPPFINPPPKQLSPAWWKLVKFAMHKADSLGVKLAMHDCDGFAVAGGPWITPAESMQKVVWTKTLVQGGRRFDDTLAQPESYKGYYRDIRILAYPSPTGSGISSKNLVPKVTASTGEDVQFLAEPGNKKKFATSKPCWIQLGFDKPFTCRSLVVHTSSSNYESERLLMETSDDGVHFKPLTRLIPPRHGWQDGDAPITNDIVATTARFFRFVYDKAGSEPGSEDLDFAKWKPSLKITGITLYSIARINQYEGKTGEVWRVSKRTTAQQAPDSLCIPKDKIIDLTNKLGADGMLKWSVPPGNWTILRIGHTSTGHTNATGGAGKGLECDKFNPGVVRKQFNHWFGEAVKQAGPQLARQVLKIFHVDSWECGSQNWSPVFAAEFKKRRGYDLMPYLPVMAGVPVQSAAVSEKVLSDVRKTIAELVVDNFYGTMAKLAHAQGCQFSAECVAPVFTSDDLLHYSKVDLPMGEFWLRSPTHDKPNDVLDAISGGHIYGKPIIQAEAFTELRLMWDEYPGMMKTLADRNLALGINRFVFHVDVLNPWLNRKPGMTLNGVGSFFQRDQTWWKPAKAWFQYIERCQAMLQQGRPVTDIAVFTGYEIPRRAILPDRLVKTLPGLFGERRVKDEQRRLANIGEPMRTIPDKVSSSANMADPEKWVNPLRSYAYDSINLDALRLATVRNGRIVLPGGASYGVLVIPGSRPMASDSTLMSPQAIRKIFQLVKAGATIIMDSHPNAAPGLAGNETVRKTADSLFNYHGKGRVITGPYQDSTLDNFGISRDLAVIDSTGNDAPNVAWNHRAGKGFDSYFISNQEGKPRTLSFSLRIDGRIPELWNPVTGETYIAGKWKTVNGRTVLPLHLDAGASVFVVFRHPTKQKFASASANWPTAKEIKTISGSWSVQFDKAYGGSAGPVKFDRLTDWTANADDRIKYYSGTAWYSQSFEWNGGSSREVWLDLGKVDNIANVYVNGKFYGTAWTYPYRVNIGPALKKGRNELVVAVSNTWANRLIGDHSLPANKQITWTNAVFRLEGKPLLPAGLLGPVKLVRLKY